MISVYYFHPTRFYFWELSSCFSRDFKLSILSNPAEHLKGLVPYYVLPPFYNSKIFIPNGSAGPFREDDFS